MQKIISRPVAILLAVVMTVLFIPAPSYATDTADDVTYSIKSGAECDFDEDDFNTVCEDLNGETLKYVKFELPSSSKGTLYFKYEKSGEEEVDDGDKYYYDEDDGDYFIGDVTFVPKSGYSGKVTISYTGKDDDGNTFNGDIVITVNDSGDADDIKYTVYNDDTVDFSKKDFNEACQDQNDADLDYVNFTLPSSSKGILYYKYDTSSEAKVSKSTDYEYGGSPSISDITFVPDDEYTGTVTIKYKGYDEDGESFTGSVVITVKEGSGSSSGSGDINYKGDAGEEIDFDESDFNDYCKDENNEKLDYVTFSVPASSKGILYYDYDGSDEAKVKDTEKYYYGKDPSIDDITFIPKDSFSGNCKISFEGKDKDGDSIDGDVVIAVANEDHEADTIYLSGIAGSPVTIYDEYINKECKEVLNDTLDYVKFTLPSAASGTLYYNYTSSGSSSKVSASTKYYYEDSPYLKKVAFVSANKNAGTYTIEYTGYGSDGASFTGSISITLTAGTGTSSGSGSLYFSDVSGDYSWAVLYVDTLYSTSVIPNAMLPSSTKYNPGVSITRGDFMLLLCRALNISSASATGNFSDVPAGSYYYDAIAAAKSLGIAQGSNNKFYPTTTITREDAMALALRAMNLSGYAIGSGDSSSLSRFSDRDSVSSYAKDAVAALINAGIITGGSDGQIHPKSSITRAESAAIVYRIKY